MENTPENKAKFFAQYWGQRVSVEIDGTVKSSVLFGRTDWNLSESDIENTILELKPLSQITDEDALAVANILTYRKIKQYDLREDWKEVIATKDIYGLAEVTDLLRSKGYALPYMGISVEQQIEYGWIKLRSEI